MRLNFCHRLHLVMTNGLYRVIQLSWTTTTSNGAPEIDDLAWVARIDGRRVDLTPLKSMLVPPPASAFVLHLPDAVKEVRKEPQKIIYFHLLKQFFSLSFLAGIGVI